MREILFRGKRTDNGEWIEGNLFVPDFPEAPTEICIGTNVVRIIYEVIPETVGQYTGLTDKNGKKIFEGDFLKSQDEILHNKDNVSLVKAGQWNCGCCYAVYGFSTTNEEIGFGDECVIVGNIHDNPELLGGVE